MRDGPEVCESDMECWDVERGRCDPPGERTRSNCCCTVTDAKEGPEDSATEARGVARGVAPIVTLGVGRPTWDGVGRAVSLEGPGYDAEPIDR